MGATIPERPRAPPEACSNAEVVWHLAPRFSGMDEPSATARPTFDEIRTRHPNAYERWTAPDDSLLLAGYRDGRSIEDLAQEFSRQPSAIESRLSKLALQALRPPNSDDDYPWDAIPEDPEPPDLF